MRVAVVGLGEAGRDIHVPALARLEGVTLQGACDPDPERRASFQAAVGVQCFESLDRLLDVARPEVVVVGTPPWSHEEVCLRSLDAGCHVICEKPFVASVEEADRIIARAARVGRQVALNHEFKEMPAFRAVLEAVAGDGPGEPRFAQAWQLMHRPPWEESGWRGALEHRTLYEAGIHLVDFLVALYGEPPVSVSASVSAGGEVGRKVDAVALATLEFSRGRLAQLVQTRLCRGGSRYFEVRADTARASYRASHGGRARLTLGLFHSTRPGARFELGLSGMAWREVGHRRTVLARNPPAPMVRATAELFRRTLDAFRDGTRPPVPAEEARTLIGVVAGCYLSAETGRRITLDGGLGEVAGVRLGRRGEGG